MHKATSIKYIQYSNTFSRKIIFPSLLEFFYALQYNLIDTCGTSQIEPCIKMFGFPSIYSTGTLLPCPPFNMALQLPHITFQYLHNLPTSPHHLKRAKKKKKKEV